MKVIETKRKPNEDLLVHIHEGARTTVGRRMQDLTGRLVSRCTHYMTWNYMQHRHRWEAVCEHKDELYVSPAYPEDEPFRKGRTL